MSLAYVTVAVFPAHLYYRHHTVTHILNRFLCCPIGYLPTCTCLRVFLKIIFILDICCRWGGVFMYFLWQKRKNERVNPFPLMVWKYNCFGNTYCTAYIIYIKITDVRFLRIAESVIWEIRYGFRWSPQFIYLYVRTNSGRERELNTGRFCFCGPRKEFDKLDKVTWWVMDDAEKRLS